MQSLFLLDNVSNVRMESFTSTLGQSIFIVTTRRRILSITSRLLYAHCRIFHIVNILVVVLPHAITILQDLTLLHAMLVHQYIFLFFIRRVSCLCCRWHMF